MTTDPAPPAAATPNEDSLQGLGFAVSAYFLWGFLPLYMKMLAHISPIEVLAHRVIWSVPIAGLVLIVLRRTRDLRAALANPRMLGMAAVTAALISLNWGVYVWAIVSGRALEAALGYYINPLFSVALGAILLRERLAPLQWAAVGLVVVAVAILTIAGGSVPWVALILTTTFGFYAFFRKTLPIGPNQGFLLEVLILLPLALAYVAVMGGTGNFATGSARDTALLMGCGVVTAVPLILYANGAKRLKLSTIGMLQYIAPTMIFLTAVFIFKEPFGWARAVAFPLIWAALGIYTLSMVRQSRAARRG